MPDTVTGTASCTTSLSSCKPVKERSLVCSTGQARKADAKVGNARQTSKLSERKITGNAKNFGFLDKDQDFGGEKRENNAKKRGKLSTRPFSPQVSVSYLFKSLPYIIIRCISRPGMKNRTHFKTEPFPMLCLPRFPLHRTPPYWHFLHQE